MIAEKLNAIKKYFDKYLKKNIICFNFSSAAVLILLTRKSDSDLRFCVNYQTLNVIIIKNCYSIFFIEEILN